MDTALDILGQCARDAFVRLFGEQLDAGLVSGIGVAATTNPEFGDYQCNAAMAVGKRVRKAPREVAQAVATELSGCGLLSKVEVAGPGFINLTLGSDWLAGRLGGMNADAGLGVANVGQGRCVILDYSSPNVAKPMHIGHIRSTILGNALDRMHRYLGYRVVADNHLGDWGTQFGILIMGCRHFADAVALRERPIEELERVYVLSYGRSQADEEWMKQCRQELVKLQGGDESNRSMWRQFVEWSLVEFERIYARLGVSFDLVRGESHYNDRLPAILKLLEEKGLAKQSEGATVVTLEEEGLPVCLVRKSDGGFNYATTDLATVLSRVEEFKPERIVYVTDERQQLHFRQIFAVCRRLGVTVPLEHVWFGLMRLPEGTFSTREGNVIKLERLLDEAERRAFDVVCAASPEMPEEQRREVARAVGIGAVKYADLSQNPQTTITFTWDKALALDGNSAPYLQYAYARIASVLDKYAAEYPGVDPSLTPIVFGEPIERALGVKLMRWPELVARAADGYRPSVLADYLYELAQTYSTFYQNVPFLKAPAGVRESRIRLCGLTARVMKKGLELLGIEAPARI